MKIKPEYIIRSTERSGKHCYFVVIHGSTPMFSTLDRAKRFGSESEAHRYAMRELFTTSTAFKIERVTKA